MYTNVVFVNAINNFKVDKSFILKFFRIQNIHFEFLNFWDFWTISNGDKPYTKILVADKVENFIIEMFFIWNCLGAKIFNTRFIKVNIRGQHHIPSHKWVCSIVENLHARKRAHRFKTLVSASVNWFIDAVHPTVFV